jgi:hypothetical protein
VKGTRSRYERCIRSMGRWMKDKGLVPSSRLIPPLNQSAVEKFFDHLDNKRVKWRGHPNPSQVKRLSLGAVRAVGSAIFHLYRIHSLAVCDRLKIFFNNFNRYHILNIAQDKAHVPPLFPSSGSSEAISVCDTTESKGLTHQRRHQNRDRSVLISPTKPQPPEPHKSQNFLSTPSIARQSNPRQARVTPKS